MTQKGLHLKGITLKLAYPTKQQRALQIIYRLLYIVMIMIISTGCYKDNIDNNDYKVYEIKKGNHYSNNHNTIQALTTKSKIQANIIFKRTCLYNEINTIDSLDQNKLIGLSDGIDHHNNSIRWAWRKISDTDQIQISIYAYVNTQRIIIPVDTIQTEHTHHYTVAIYNNAYILGLDNNVYKIPRASRYTGIRYRLYPYFGGNHPAPNHMQIHIRWE